MAGEGGRLATWLAGRFVLRPTSHAIDSGAQVRFQLPAGKSSKSIEAFAHVDPQRIAEGLFPDLLVLKLPGTGGRAERSPALPSAVRFSGTSEVWTWNPPGYGGSSGKASLKKLPVASLAFFDAVTKMRRGEKTRVVLMGNSLGCAVAMWLAANREVDGLVLRNPPPLSATILNVATRQRSRLYQSLIRLPARWVGRGIPAALDILQTAPKCTAPALFVQCSGDSLVPPELQAKVRQAYAGPHRLVVWEGLEHHEVPEEKDAGEYYAELEWIFGTQEGK
ncbi:Alpha/beta hydrolase family protein [Roseimaritima multifibrata]|uniref:Alpha/beta hydrolase family protein n=2 Tax=Roseimaritima multifibrata TaxID=1930274 RepID=A0A517MNM8_9BACT|nr:Alpha/beta hydrolase family protein [Roseimaritima multifibrata]